MLNGYKNGYVLCQCGYLQGVVNKKISHRVCSRCGEIIKNSRIYFPDEVDPYTRQLKPQSMRPDVTKDTKVELVNSKKYPGVYIAFCYPKDSDNQIGRIGIHSNGRVDLRMNPGFKLDPVPGAVLCFRVSKKEGIK